MSTDRHQFDPVSKKIIGASFEVVNTLGRGFVEEIYATALVLELDKIGLFAKREFPVSVLYKGHLVDNFYCDLLVENSIIVETKATSG